MFATASQLIGLAFIVAGSIVLAGVGGFLLGAGVTAIYVGLAADRDVGKAIDTITQAVECFNQRGVGRQLRLACRLLRRRLSNAKC